MYKFNIRSKKSENKIDNVIPFRNHTGVRRAKMKLEVNQKKVAITASIVSIAFIVAFINQQLLKSQQSQNRGIASVQSIGVDTAWQFELAKKLSKETRRDLASIGTKPNEMDELRFGLLEGKYSLRFDEGSLSEIAFIEKESAERPKYIEDKESFLKTYKNLFKISFKDVKKVDARNPSVAADTKEDVFELVDEYEKVQGKALFLSDSSGRILSMKINKVTIQ